MTNDTQVKAPEYDVGLDLRVLAPGPQVVAETSPQGVCCVCCVYIQYLQ